MSDWSVAKPPGPDSGTPIPTLGSVDTNLYQRPQQVARLPKVGGNGQLAGSAAAMYTAPSLTSVPTGSDFAVSLVYSITLCNTDSSPQTYTLYRVPVGDSAADDNAFVDAVSLAAGETVFIEWDKGLPMHTGDFLSGFSSSASKITYIVAVEELAY